MRNEPANFPAGDSVLCSPVPTSTLCLYTIPGYTTYDGSVGISKDNWTVQATGSNLTNSNAATNITSAQSIESKNPLRPRVLTLQVGYKF
jgi:outer membrane receptor protein involved in Fe transport